MLYEVITVNEGNQRKIECIAKPHETGCFYWWIDVKNTRQMSGLIRNHSNRFSAKARESNNNVLSVLRLDFQEVLVVNNCLDYLVHIVWFVP